MKPSIGKCAVVTTCAVVPHFFCPRRKQASISVPGLIFAPIFTPDDGRFLPVRVTRQPVVSQLVYEME
jgi:hypothetical protein